MVRMPLRFSWVRSERSEKASWAPREWWWTRRERARAERKMIGSGGSSSRVREGDSFHMNPKPTTAEKKSTKAVRVPTPTMRRTRPMSLMARAMRSPLRWRAKKPGPCSCRWS
jgi:hypothetical protein